jgi:hypothetical protein
VSAGRYFDSPLHQSCLSSLSVSYFPGFPSSLFPLSLSFLHIYFHFFPLCRAHEWGLLICCLPFWVLF